MGKRDEKPGAIAPDLRSRLEEWVRRHNQSLDLAYIIAEAERVCRTAIKRCGFVRSRSLQSIARAGPKRPGTTEHYISEPGGWWKREFRSAEWSAYKKSEGKVIDAAQNVLWKIRFLREAMESGDPRKSGLQGVHLGESIMWFNSVAKKIDPQRFERLKQRFENLTKYNQRRHDDSKSKDARRRELMSYFAGSGDFSDWAAAEACSKRHRELGSRRSFWNTHRKANRQT